MFKNTAFQNATFKINPRPFFTDSVLPRFGLLAVSSLLAMPTIANDSAPASSDVLDEVVVEAFRLPSSITDTGSSVWIVDEAMIKSRAYMQMTDALTSVPGVTVNQNGAFGGQATARIRGASSDQTLVLIDGIVVNDVSSPGGGFNFGTIDISDVQRIEVLKGPQSTLWGSDAIGGVINIVSKKPERGLTGDVSAAAGSFGTQQYRAAIAGGNDTGDFRISYNDITSDGISKAEEDDGNPEEDNYDSQTLAVKGGVNLPADARLQFSYRSTDSDTEFDSFGFVTGVQDGDELTQTELTSAQVTLTFPFFGDRLQNTIRYGDTELERNSFSNGAPGFSAQGERQVLQYQGTVLISDAHQVSVGYEDEEADDGTNTSSNTGIFALYQLDATEDITVSLGVRQDDNDEYGSETVSRVSAAWAFNSNIDLRASWGEGFKVPTIFQTTFFCCGAVAPNPDLKPEVSEAFDIGVDWRFLDGDASLSLTYFNQDTENQINFSFGIGGYENIDEVESKGVELAFDYQINETLFVSTNISHIDSEDGNGQELIQLPALTADVAVNWQPLPKLSTTLAVVYNDEEEHSRGTLNSWTRLDLSAIYLLNEHVELFGRMENLGDKDYQQIFGYGTPERSGYVGVTYTF